MLSKHFSIISCLLLHFVGTAADCYSDGMQFDNTVTNGDMEKAIVGFCNKHGGTQFTLNEKLGGCMDVSKGGSKHSVNMEITFTGFPNNYGLVNLTTDGCKWVLTRAEDKCSKHGGKDIETGYGSGMDQRKKIRGDSAHGEAENAFDEQSQDEDLLDGDVSEQNEHTPEKSSQHQNGSDSDGQDQEDNEEQHTHTMTYDSHNGSITTTTTMEGTTLFSTLDPPKTVFITTFITKTKGKKYKTKTKTKTRIESEKETETQTATKTITTTVISISTTSSMSSMSSTAATPTSTSCSRTLVGLQTDGNFSPVASDCGAQPTTPNPSTTSSPMNIHFNCKVKIDPNNDSCAATPTPSNTADGNPRPGRK